MVALALTHTILASQITDKKHIYTADQGNGFDLLMSHATSSTTCLSVHWFQTTAKLSCTVTPFEPDCWPRIIVTN